MRESFNVSKSNRLQAINQQGQREASKKMLEAIAKQACEAGVALAEATKECDRLKAEIASLQMQLVTPTPFEQTAEYARLAATLADSRAAEDRAGKSSTAALEALNAQIQAVCAESRELQQQKGKANQVEAQRKRIAELEAQEKDLSAQYEELEKGIYLCDLFTKAKVRMLTDRINGKFKSVRFRLFVEQQNGGIRDDCEVLVPNEETGVLVPYRDANNAGRIKAGLEIINVLSTHWDLAMPVFIDNAEGVQNIAGPNTQLIQLVVPVSWDKLGSVVQSALIHTYGSEKWAREQYESPNKKLRLELAEEPSRSINAA